MALGSFTSSNIELKAGKTYILQSFSDDKVSGKLISMGILPGMKLTIIRKAPFGGAYYVKLDMGCFLAVSNKEMSSLNLMEENV